jgi:predicted nuclease of predicted toxin-antitoxin system
MKFLLDANLAPVLARHLRAAGYDCVHVTEILSPAAKDTEIALEANRLQAVLITKDSDFLALRARGSLAVSLVWLRCGNMSNRQTSQMLLSAMPRIVTALAAGERVIEIR